jgi:Ca2+-binding RTX toxin-like protein
VSLATIVLALANVDAVQAQTTEIIAGTDGPDELIGTPGDDTINGRHDADVMTGLAGNDTYIVDDEADRVVEQADEGIDTVRVFGSYKLPAYVENLIMMDSDGFGRGNTLANRMIGSSGYNHLSGAPGNDILTGRGGIDWLDGGLGNDILTGGADFDAFMFTTELNANNNFDRVMDFTVGEDQLFLTYRAFGAFRTCSDFPWLEEQMLHIGASATTAEHRIVYNPSNGVLYYDSDGSGPTPAVRFARLSPDLPLTYQAFQVQYGGTRYPCP